MMNIFWKIKESITLEKEGIEYHRFDHTIGLLYFLHIDLMCHRLMLNWEFSYEKYKKENPIT